MTSIDSANSRILYGAKAGVGLGFIVGGGEVVAHALTMKLPLSWFEFLLLSLTNVIVMGVFSLAVGFGCGLMHLITKKMERPKAISIHLGLTGGALALYYLAQIARSVYTDQGRPAASLILLIMPVFFGLMVYLNTHYWARKVQLGVEYKYSFATIGFGLGLGISVAACVGYQTKTPGNAAALEDDKNVMLITIDTLRRDHIGAYGEAPAAPTPHMDALAKDGILFMDAITPMPETAPAHASMMTGRHPIRHGVLSNTHKLAGHQETLAEVLSGEGYATAAFVSSFAVDSRVGLDQGFQVYDDDLAPLPGLSHINLLQWTLKVWMAVGNPAATPWMLERGGKQTNARLFGWLDQNAEKPFFAWVHYFEPHAPYEPWGLEGFAHNGTPENPAISHRDILPLGDAATYTEADHKALHELYREEVSYSDGLVGEVLAKIDELGIKDETLVIVTADHGEMLGEHGLNYHHHGMFDEVLRIPLIIRAPGTRAKTRIVEQQVRLMDLANTVLDYLKIDPMKASEGVELMGYAEGVRSKTIWSSLVGRRARSFAEGALVGMRSNGVKYIRDIVTGEESLYHLLEDPKELVDLKNEQPEVLEKARRLIASEVEAFSSQVNVNITEVDASEAKMLEMLGYTQ